MHKGWLLWGWGEGWDCLLSHDRPLKLGPKAYSFTDFIQGQEEQMFPKMHAQCGKKWSDWGSSGKSRSRGAGLEKESEARLGAAISGTRARILASACKTAVCCLHFFLTPAPSALKQHTAQCKLSSIREVVLPRQSQPMPRTITGFLLLLFFPCSKRKLIISDLSRVTAGLERGTKE